MAKKIACKLGDFFKIPVDDNVFCVGRILIIQSSALLVGFYDVLLNQDQQVDITQLIQKKYLIKLKCSYLGLREKEWSVIGNVPFEKKETLPLFWGTDLLTGSLYLREYVYSDDDPLGLGAKFKEWTATKEEIERLDAQPDGLSGSKAAEMKLKMYLQKTGIMGETYH